jgi:hypothetical protein
VASAAPPASSDINLDPQKSSGLQQAIATPVVPVVVPPVTPPVVVPEVTGTIIWGRWAPVLGQAVTIDLTKYDAKAKTIALRDSFALLQLKGTEWQLPTTGNMGFALQDSEAYVNNQTTGTVTAAKVQNGSLTIDFAKASFSTSIDLLTNNEIFKRQAQGRVFSDGQFTSLNLYPSTMSVNGVLTSEKGGSAAYLFQTYLDGDRTISGVTVWGKH